MTQTENLNLKKPDYTDPVDIKDINDNMDIIDENIDKLNKNISITDILKII